MFRAARSLILIRKNQYLVTLALVSSRRNRQSPAQTSIFTIENQHFLIQMAPQPSWPPSLPADCLQDRSPQPRILSQGYSARNPQPGILEGSLKGSFEGSLPLRVPLRVPLRSQVSDKNTVRGFLLESFWTISIFVMCLFANGSHRVWK